MDDRVNQKHSQEWKAKITNFAQKIASQFWQQLWRETMPLALQPLVLSLTLPMRISFAYYSFYIQPNFSQWRLGLHF